MHHVHKYRTTESPRSAANYKLTCVLTYAGMSKCVIVFVDYGHRKSDVWMGRLQLLLHIN